MPTSGSSGIGLATGIAFGRTGENVYAIDSRIRSNSGEIELLVATGHKTP
jgi:hypothetical protein